MSRTINFKRELTRPLQLATLILSLSMGWLFLSAYHLLQTQQQLSDIDDFRYQLISLQRTIVDAETGQRGYLITNNPTFLDPYLNGPAKAEKLIKALENSPIELPGLQTKIESLRRYAVQKFKIIDATIQVQLHAGAYASHLSVSKDNGKIVMEKIEAIINDMDAWLLESKKNITVDARRILSQVILGSIILVLVVSGILLFSYRRTVLLFEQAIENRIKSERLSFEADHDPLTKLPNRRGLNTHLRKIHSLSRRMEDLYAVFYMDLDGFKLVNDRLGHEAGDAVLVTTTSLFTQVLRDTDFLARAGGDEFVLVIHRYRDDNELELLAQRIINSLKQPIMVNQKYCHIGVSIGIARYPADAKHLDSILQIADSLMYKSKEAGKNRYTFA